MTDDPRPGDEHGDGTTPDPWALPVPALEPYPGQQPGAPDADGGPDVTAPVPVVPAEPTPQDDAEHPAAVDEAQPSAPSGVPLAAPVGPPIAVPLDPPASEPVTEPLADDDTDVVDAGSEPVDGGSEPVDGGRAARRRAAEAAAAAAAASAGASSLAGDDAPADVEPAVESDSEIDGWAPQEPDAEDPPAGDLPADWSEAQSAGGRAARRRAAEDAARVQSHRAHNRLVVFGVVAIVVLAVAGLAWTWLSRQAPAPDPQPTASASPTGPTQPTLLLQVADDQGVAVSNALLSVGGPLGRANVIGIPQNTLMDVATGGTLPFGQINRLPDPGGSAGALSDAIGVDVNGTLVLDPGALSGLVDAVGGITADVDVDVTQEKADGTTVIIVPAGPGQVLQGQQAEAFATFLDKGETEEARMARFAQVLRLTVAKLPTDGAKIETILTQLGASARATVPFTQLADFFLRLNADVNADDVAYKNLPVQGIDTGGPAAYRVDQEATAVLVQDLLPDALRTPGPNSKVRVLVQNGVGSPGLNTAARTLLVDAGFTFVNGGNASSFGQTKTNVILPDTTPESLAWGADITKALGLPDSAVKVAEDGQSVADVIVVLGEDFKPTAS